MPLRQSQMIEQMNEARALCQQLIALRNFILNYSKWRKAQPQPQSEADFHAVLDTFIYEVKRTPLPDDRVTYKNEAYYRRHAKSNDRLRERQEIARRMAGVPTQEEALAILNARNVLTRAGLPNDPAVYEKPQSKFDPELARQYEEFAKANPYRPPAIEPVTTDEDIASPETIQNDFAMGSMFDSEDKTDEYK